MVRHGESEANLVQRGFRNNENFIAPEVFQDRHDSVMLLTPRGVEQAQAAGEWLKWEYPEGFDHYHVSTLLRAEQTAGHLGLPGAEWVLDDRLREQDWGEVGALGAAEHKRLYPNSYRLMQQNRWYWSAPGGESYATHVRLRWERLLGTMHREQDYENTILVAHGGTLSVGRVILERLQIPEWLAQDEDPAYNINNTQILTYTRDDPETGEDAGKLQWMRSICPWDESKSWFGGRWVKLVLDRKLTNEQLLAKAELYPPLLPDIQLALDQSKIVA
jgi:broad specificity phosphatase PhoE